MFFMLSADGSSLKRTAVHVCGSTSVHPDHTVSRALLLARSGMWCSTRCSTLMASQQLRCLFRHSAHVITDAQRHLRRIPVHLDTQSREACSVKKGETPASHRSSGCSQPCYSEAWMLPRVVVCKTLAAVQVHTAGPCSPHTYHAAVHLWPHPTCYTVALPLTQSQSALPLACFRTD